VRTLANTAAVGSVCLPLAIHQLAFEGAFKATATFQKPLFVFAPRLPRNPLREATPGGVPISNA
jgi:hypothetical protein